MPDSRHPTLEVLAIPNVRYFVASRFFSATSYTLIRASVSWDIYARTESALSLGLIGIAQFLPVLPFTLVGGAVADSYDRRTIIFRAQLVAVLLSSVLAYSAWNDLGGVAVVYGIVFLLSIVNAFESPARSAMMPNLVSRERFVTAATIHSVVTNVAWVTGPVVTGFVIHAYGVPASYGVNAVLIAIAWVLMHFVHPPKREGGGRRITLRIIYEGLQFVRVNTVILAAMSLDLFAVVFAGATALLPIYAEDILHVGARGYGLLSAALEIGTVIAAVALLVLPPIQRPGRALLFAVGVFGVATILFGFSRSFPLSVLAFMLAGMADAVSMVARATILQLATPDELRGRVNSVNLVFVSASNQLGVAESGLLAALTNATFSVVFGGFACLGALAFAVVKAPSLARFRVDEQKVES